MSESFSISKAITTSTTFVDKAIEFRHFMLLISFLLALDSSLMIFYKKNLLQSFGSLDAPEVNAAGALVFLGVFAILMALFFPVVRQILLLIVQLIAVRLPLPRPEINHDVRSVYLVREKALIERDKLVIELLDKQQDQNSEHHTNMNIGFSLVIIFLVNYLVVGTDQLLSLTQTAVKLVDVIEGFWVSVLLMSVLATFACFLTAMLINSLTPPPPSRIYLPETDEEKNARFDRANRMVGYKGRHLG